MTKKSWHGVCYTETIEEHHGHDQAEVHRQRFGVIRDVFWFDSVSEATTTPAAWATEIINDLAPGSMPVWAVAPPTLREMHERLHRAFRYSVNRGGVAAEPRPPKGAATVPSIHVAADGDPFGVEVGSRTERGEELHFANLGRRDISLVGRAWSRADIVEIASGMWQPAEILVSQRCGPIDDDNPAFMTAWFDAVDDEMLWPVFDPNGDPAGRATAEEIWGPDWVDPI